MLIIPLAPVPSQTLTVQLSDQICQITVSQRLFGLLLNLSVNNSIIIGGVICRDRDRIVRDAYLGFNGDLAFVDRSGNEDPVYTGLGSRFSLAYIDSAELASIEA